MKFSIASKDLESLVASAIAVSKGMTPIQLLAERIGEDIAASGPGMIETAAEPGILRVIAYNDNIVSEWRRPIEIRLSGSIAVQPDGMDRLVRASKGSEATFVVETLETDNAQSLRLATSRSAHEFAAQSDAVFSKIAPGYVDGPRADLSNLAVAIDTARLAIASRGDATGAKIALTAIHIQSRDGLVDVVGTDGKRMAVTSLGEDLLGAIDFGRSDDTGFNLPQEAIGLAISMLSEGPARLVVQDNNLIIENGDGVLSVRLVDAPYPDYTALFGIKTTERISLLKETFDLALQRSAVSLAKDKRTVAVKLSRGADGLHVSSAASGQSSSECLSTEPGPDTLIGFDARYMLSAISAFPKTDINIDFASAVAPIRITSKSRPETIMIVMPCRV